MIDSLLPEDVPKQVQQSRLDEDKKYFSQENCVKTKNMDRFIGKSALMGTVIFISCLLVFSSAQAEEVGWQKIIDDGFYMHETDPANRYNCDKICSGCVVDRPGTCSEVCTAEFYCAGPWRSYAGLWGVGNAYLFLSYYGNMPPVQVRKGWAVWQWEVKTSARYKVEVFYRPTENRSPDADYYVFSLKALGEMQGMKPQDNMVINQTLHGPLQTQGWVTLGEYEYQRGEIAAVGLWAHDDTYSDEADGVRWTLMEKIANKGGVTPAATFLLRK